MKSLIVIKSFLRKNIVPIFIVMLTMTISLFLLVTVYGEYKYITQARDIYEDAGLEDDVYFTFNYGLKENDINSPYKSREKLYEFKAFNYTLDMYSSADSYNENIFNIKYYSNAMINSFKLKTVSGRWLSSTSGKLEAVIGGTLWDGVNIGDKLTLSNGLTVEIVGILGKAVLQPNFTSSSSKFSATNLFKASENLMILNMSAIDSQKLQEISPQLYFNYFVVFKENASQEEKDLLVSYLETYGHCITYDEIIKNSNAEILQQAKELFPLPIFLLIVSTVALISICSLAIKRSMSEHSKFFLIGCSKKRSVVLITASLTLIFSIPCLLNIILTLYFPSFLRYDNIMIEKLIINSECVYPIILYMLLILLITTFIPIILYKNYSPLDFYRRNL